MSFEADQELAAIEDTTYRRRSSSKLIIVTSGVNGKNPDVTCLRQRQSSHNEGRRGVSRLTFSNQTLTLPQRPLNTQNCGMLIRLT